LHRHPSGDSGTRRARQRGFSAKDAGSAARRDANNSARDDASCANPARFTALDGPGCFPAFDGGTSPTPGAPTVAPAPAATEAAPATEAKPRKKKRRYARYGYYGYPYYRRSPFYSWHPRFWWPFYPPRYRYYRAHRRYYHRPVFPFFRW
jgi:hypothetical protein